MLVDATPDGVVGGLGDGPGNGSIFGGGELCDGGGGGGGGGPGSAGVTVGGMLDVGALGFEGLPPDVVDAVDGAFAVPANQ
jgi:hypothetical protein